MLNREGWSLLMILALLIVELLLALPKMGMERTVAQRLECADGGFGTALGVALRCAGALGLAVLPGLVAQGGVIRVLPLVGVCLALGAMLGWIIPKVRAGAPGALTLAEALTEEKDARGLLGGVCALSALAAGTGALALLARVFASVFSLHYLIALGAATGLCALLAVLCGTASRKRVDKAHVWLLVVFLVAVPVLTYMTRTVSAREVLRGALEVEWNGKTALGMASDALLGLSALGLLLPAQRLLSARQGHARRAGIWSGALCMGLLAVCAGLGVYGGFVKAELTTLTAAETVLVQLGSAEVLPAPVGGVLIAILTLTLALFAQEALRCVGLWVAWDVVEARRERHSEKLLNWVADGCAVAAAVVCFGTAINSHRELTFFAQESMLLGSIAGVTLALRACGVKATARGMKLGVAIALPLTILWLFLPTGLTIKPFGWSGIALATALPQVLLREKAADREEPQEEEAEEQEESILWTREVAAEQTDVEEQESESVGEEAEPQEGEANGTVVV